MDIEEWPMEAISTYVGAYVTLTEEKVGREEVKDSMGQMRNNEALGA